jgi:hypothetical protein
MPGVNKFKCDFSCADRFRQKTHMSECFGEVISQGTRCLDQ